MLEQTDSIILNQIQPSEDHVNIHIYCSSPTFQKLITLATWEKEKNKSKLHLPDCNIYSFRQFYHKLFNY